MASPLVVLGLDAASPSLVRQWADEGKLPNLARVFQHGLSGDVAGVHGYYVGSTWPSFSTGLSPAGHGFHRIVQLRSGTYEFFRPLDHDSGVAGSPFWALASQAGKQVAVLDVPLVRLDPTLNGIQIVEWGGHDSVFGLRTHPSALADHVRELVGAYPAPVNCDAARPQMSDFQTFIDQLEAAVSARARLTLDLLESSPWDLFMQVFTESHCIGHQCWHIHDPDHPAHEPQLLDEIGDPLERVYRSIDSGVGAILDACREATVLILSAHGMSTFRGANALLPEILVRLGVTTRRRRRPRTLTGWSKAAARRALRLLPSGARHRPHSRQPVVGPGSLPGSRIPSFAFDPAASACFPIANGQPVSGIRLNVVDREPHGLLHPGAAVEAFVAELRRDLLEITDARSGAPLIESVELTADLFRGDRIDALPDILVTWNDVPTGTIAHGDGRGATVTATSPKIGTVSRTNRYVRTGDHIAEGWFVIAGPEVTPGELPEPVSVMDFHPTVCALLGLETPQVDGRIIPGLV